MLREIKGDLFNPSTYRLYPDAIVITTNGHIKKDGQAVMGRGCALEAKNRWPDISVLLGKRIRDGGNHVHFLLRIDVPLLEIDILSFPVKYCWYEDANLDLIRRSCKELLSKALASKYKNVILPRPGCGNGKLSWDIVKPILEEELGDESSCNFHVITY